MQGVKKLWIRAEIITFKNTEEIHFSSHQKSVLAHPYPNKNSDVCLPGAGADGHLTFGLDKKPLSKASIFREDFLNPSSSLLAFQEPSLEASGQNILPNYGKETSEPKAFCCSWKMVMRTTEEKRSERER